jgi:hypothetical protein
MAVYVRLRSLRSLFGLTSSDMCRTAFCVSVFGGQAAAALSILETFWAAGRRRTGCQILAFFLWCRCGVSIPGRRAHSRAADKPAQGGRVYRPPWAGTLGLCSPGLQVCRRFFSSVVPPRPTQKEYPRSLRSHRAPCVPVRPPPGGGSLSHGAYSSPKAEEFGRCRRGKADQNARRSRPERTAKRSRKNSEKDRKSAVPGPKEQKREQPALLIENIGFF